MDRGKLSERLASLESEGRRLLSDFGPETGHVAWDLSLRNTFRLCFPEDSLYSDAYAKANNFEEKVEVAASAAREFSEGLTLEELRFPYIRALFSDLLSEAQPLLDEGFLRCAGVVARVGLERKLRELAKQCGIQRPDEKKPATLNQELWKTNAYGKTTWSEIASWLTLGNEAAHMPDFDEKYNVAQVQRVITGVSAFLDNAT